MKEEQVIELKVSEESRKQVMNRIEHAHIRGLDIEKAKELGVFKRISLLLCGMHSLNVVSNRIWGSVNLLLEMLHADKKHDIRVAYNRFQQAFDDYLSFWSKYYSSKGNAVKEMNNETEELYHQFMKWAQLPETWGLGDDQTLHSETYSMLQIASDNGDDVIHFHRSMIDSEVVGEPDESWVVTRYDMGKRQQIIVGEDMDKASAQMVAKRLSADDKENVYIASRILQYTQKVKEVLPEKAYRCNEVIGNTRKVLKKR